MEASGTTFWFRFKTLHLLEPRFVVVVTIYPSDAQTFRMTFAFILADFIFLTRIDVGVEVEDGGTNVVLQHPLDNGRGAGRTTGVEKDFVETFGNEDFALFLHVQRFRVAKVGKYSEK